MKTNIVDIRYRRQDFFDIHSKKLLPFSINGQDFLVYNNVNLSIFVTDFCNGECDFCVAQLRYFQEGSNYVKPQISDDDLYFRRLEQMLEIVKPLNPSVSLTGGEPTKSERLPEILKILKKFNVRKRTITTNGSGLIDRYKNDSKTILDHLIDYKLVHLNISRAHYNEEANNRIMKMNNTGLTNKQLEEVVKKSLSAGIRPRLSCVLIKNGINNIDQITQYLDWAESIGVDNVVFRQLMKFDKSAVKPGRITNFCSTHEVDLISLWEKLDHDKRFSFLNHVLGYYYYVEVFKYRSIDMVSEMADLTLIHKEMAKRDYGDKPIIYELVFHMNGNLCGSWCEWKDIVWE